MAMYVKTLNDGQLGNTAKGTTLYVVPSGKAAVIKNFRLANNEASTARTVNIYYLRSGLSDTNARLILQRGLSITAGNVVVDANELTMAAGDKIIGDASVANMIDFVVSGVERDA